jgi:hypothetical protein
MIWASGRITSVRTVDRITFASHFNRCGHQRGYKITIDIWFAKWSMSFVSQRIKPRNVSPSSYKEESILRASERLKRRGDRANFSDLMQALLEAWLAAPEWRHDMAS